MEPQIATGKAECGISAFQTVQALVVGGHVHSARKEGDAHAADHRRPGCGRQGLRQVQSQCISHGLVSVVSFLKSCAWIEVSRSTNEEPIKFFNEEAN